jgi:citrate lyase subunit beta/citryl-CoA lyase
MKEQPVWRSMLIGPVTQEGFIKRAAESGADAVILDLEDSVPPARKPEARTILPEVAAKIRQGGPEVVVRINRPLRLAVADLEAAVIPGVQALMLPKCAGPEHINLLAEVVSELETEKGLPAGALHFVPLIETAAAFGRMEAIARANQRVAALSLGAEDFASDVGMVPEAETLFLPKQQMIIAARAAGVIPLGFFGTILDYKDTEAFRANILRSRRFGFEGASCIHPKLVPILNEIYSVSEQETAAARRIVEAYKEAVQAGQGAVQVDGLMVDVPVVLRAERILARAARIRQKNSR